MFETGILTVTPLVTFMIGIRASNVMSVRGILTVMPLPWIIVGLGLEKSILTLGIEINEPKRIEGSNAVNPMSVKGTETESP